ncbi:Large subunit GTPase 1 -like protein [Sarcoptes scabiei]|uniref:Large subunit GTPase 1 homolog n=1 Tax=Sarcoptes scabiei TaxID=52283 RepID=A0A132ADM6_SARSC|nr:Large subunit GTPase 1 -like protein [Sarcoptes scabiei]KPM09096.1 50S ribosome-binding GTPase-like protein 2 [Sarcoptes scabiei]
MVKTKKTEPTLALGRTLINNQRKSHSSYKSSDRHCDADKSEKSITEYTSLEEFMSKTDLIKQKFSSEHENVKFISPNKISHQQSFSSNQVDYEDEEIASELLIPRRPKLENVHSAETLKELENSNYLAWRRRLASLQSKENIILTPFEKNLEFWRQLWRVVERSDVVVQILDARNPLMFYCKDLDKYVAEIDAKKQSLILLNKSDYLSLEQRNHWLKYFNSIGKQCIFFSALEQQNRLAQDIETESQSNASEIKLLDEMTKLNLDDFSSLLNYEELIAYLKSLRLDAQSSSFAVGFVGYPNVGKSSTINALLRAKRVSVSATPGKTKHFQTMILDKELTIVDCPGLVFPNVASSKSEMIINGVLPIDQVKDVIIAIDSITSKIPAFVFEDLYGILLKQSNDSTIGSDSKVSPLELLTAYGYSRGFMTQRGLPDTSKSAKIIIKDFVSGKLLYCYSPPTIKQNEFHRYTPKNLGQSSRKISDKKLIKMFDGNNLLQKNFDEEFFNQKISSAHIKGLNSMPNQHLIDRKIDEDNGVRIEKPWRKHHNRKKKEKLRRVYAHLDN